MLRINFLSSLLFSSFLSQFGKTDTDSNRLFVHQSPSDLSPSAKTSDWPRFNGPFDNAKSSETKILKKWSTDGPTLLWELVKGEGYASPAVFKDSLILFHLLNGKEVAESRNAENGSSNWSFSYPVSYRDRYGYSNGPRASPVVGNGRVFFQGVTAWLTCLDLESGKLIWRRDLKTQFKVPDNFFGKGSNPLLWDDQLIVNVGGSEGVCVASFNASDGAVRWIAEDEWGASYSSPVRSVIHGKEVCLVFTGGESRPPTGGLLIIDPVNGNVLSRFPWRSTNYESANAVPPIPLPDNRVFLSECYEKGGVIIEFDKAFNPEIIWNNPSINLHWMTPVENNGFLYGISGRHQRGAEIFCMELDTCEIQWKERAHWFYELGGTERRLELFRGSFVLIEGDFLSLSEFGSLVWLKMDENGWKIISKSQLFFASGSWTLPSLSKGLLYVMQNETDRLSGKGPRLLCFDLRHTE